jgi:glycosyltransferase involved in cell wall biosynthesis
MKPLVMHLITTLASGGAEAMLVKLLAHASTNSHFRHKVVCLTGRGLYGPELEALGIPVTCLNMHRSPFSGAIRIIPVVRQWRPTILQSWLYHADLLGLIAGRSLRVPKIAWNVRCSDMDLRHYALTTRFIFALLSRLSGFPDTVIFNSRAGKNFHLNAGFCPKQVEIIPNGFDTDRFRPDAAARKLFRASHGIPPDAPVVGLVARLDPMKDHATFFKAAGLLHRQMPDARFVLVGRDVEPSQPSIQRWLAAYKLGEKVLALGEQTQIHRILPSFDILTLSSAFGEGFPNVLGEAMACGVPCVATDVGDSAYLIEDRDRIVPPQEASALARIWLEILHMTVQEREALGVKARARILKHFSIETVANRYDSLYHALIDADPNPAGVCNR